MSWRDTLPLAALAYIAFLWALCRLSRLTRPPRKPFIANRELNAHRITPDFRRRP